MTIALRVIAGVLLALASAWPARGEGASPAPSASDAAPAVLDAGALAERYFDETERFDAVLTYEVRRGPAHAALGIARRWRDGLAEVLFDIREPPEFAKWAMLMRQTRGGSDDLFVYGDNDTGRRVLRLSSQILEREAVFELLALGDYRPTPRGELAYESAPDESLDTVRCNVVIARSRHADLGFDELELFFAADSGLLLQTRFVRGGREVRRLTSTPADYRDIGGHRLPFRRVAKRWADGGETEILLQRAVETPDLPDGLFSDLNLRLHHFPHF
jgi:outer membrane lipoprotein-sorting protein